jgi:hypothetical protein
VYPPCFVHGAWEVVAEATDEEPCFNCYDHCLGAVEGMEFKDSKMVTVGFHGQKVVNHGESRFN